MMQVFSAGDACDAHVFRKDNVSILWDRSVDMEQDAFGQTLLEIEETFVL